MSNFHSSNSCDCLVCLHTYCRWGFGSEEFDISFSVMHKHDDHAGVKQSKSRMEEVVPNQRVDSHQEFVEGSIICAKAGICKFPFEALPCSQTAQR